jgi:Kef-type K+ transport system membrane component KefB
MNNEFNTGRPPMWRIIVYALIAMAIPFYFFYPRLGELHQYKFVFWIILPLTGVFIISLGIIPWMLKNNKAASAWMSKHRSLLVWIIFVLLIFYWLWQLHDMPRGH